jgi:PIN like domain
MVAVKDLVRFYVDESAAGLGLALAAARKDTIHVGHPLIPECPRGARDIDWIPEVAARGLVVITRDKKLRTKPVEIQTLWNHGLRVFNIGGKNDMSTWDWLARLVRYWPKMEAIITERDAGPWIYMLNEKTIDEFVPSWLRGT